MSNEWEIVNKLGGFRRQGSLSLYWEVAGDPLSDDYVPDETPAIDLFLKWRTLYSDEVQPISWFVSGAGTFEFAPFQGEEDWLTHYFWPVSLDTGEKLNFLTLPVQDKLWRPGRGDKGGFIQEVLRWKPAPFQTSANFAALSSAAGIGA